MVMKKQNLSKASLALIAVLFLSFFLNIIGINWGLPDRWNVDEPVAAALKMAYGKQLIPVDDPYHPTFYHFFLIMFMGGYLFVLKILGYPLAAAASGASVSWLNFADQNPFLASSLYLLSRSLSSVLGVATVFFTYLITKKIYSRKAGLFAALILALSAGFVEDCHYAKSSALVNFLSVITVYYCIKAAYNENFKRNFLIAGYLAGLSLATKFNAVILFAPLLFTYIYSEKRSLKTALHFIGVYFLGFISGFPGILLFVKDYLPGLIYYKENYLNSPEVGLYTRLIDFAFSVFAYIGKILEIYGFFTFLIVLFGIFTALKGKNKGRTIILSLVLPYFLLVSLFQIVKVPYPKYIILIIPFLSVFGGLFLDNFTKSKHVSGILKPMFLILGFLFTLQYVFHVDSQFLSKDIRYSTTEWVEKNIPRNSTIEIFSEPDWVFSTRLLKNYNVSLMGTDHLSGKNISSVKVWSDEEKEVNYFKGLNSYGPKAQFLIVTQIDFPEELFKHIKKVQRQTFLSKLRNGETQYRLIKCFFTQPDFGLSYSIAYMPKYIMIFKHE